MIKKIFYFVLVTIFLIACGRSNKSILEEAEHVVMNHPDSALLLLSQIELPGQLKDKEKADYWRIRSQAHANRREGMTTDSLILFSLDYYKTVNDTSNVLQSYLLAGDYFSWIELPDSALMRFYEGLDFAEMIPDTTYISEFLTHIIHVNFRLSRYPEVIEYGQKKIDYTNYHEAYYLKALGFSGNNQEDSVSYYIEKGIELALQYGESLYAAHYLRNYASILFSSGQYDEALTALRRTGEINDFYKDFGFNHSLTSRIYMNRNQLDSAQYYLEKAKKEKRKHSFGGYTDNNQVETENTLAILQAIIDARRNKPVYLGHIARFNDSIVADIKKKNNILREQITDRYNLEQQNLRLVIDKQKTYNLILLAISLTGVIAFLVYLYILKRKRKFEEIEERTETLQRLLKEAQEVKDEKENNTYFFRKILLQQLGIIRMIATSPVKQNQQLLKKIVDISNETISTDSLLKWNDLYPIIDTIYDNFYTRLRISYTDILNEKELQLCCLLCAGFSTTEISTIMQQSMQTIYQRKSSIRKKIDMDEKEDIILYLKEHI